MDGDSVNPLKNAGSADCGVVHKDNNFNEVKMRVVIKSFEPFLGLLGFMPSRVLPYMELPPGLSFPGMDVLKDIICHENKKKYAEAASAFVQELLSDKTPAGVVQSFVQALFIASDSPEEPNKVAWKLHDILNFACFYLPLQETFLKLLKEGDIDLDSLLTYPGLKCLQMLQIRTLEFLKERGSQHAAIFLLISLYAVQIKTLHDQHFQSTALKNPGSSSEMPDWIQQLVDALCHCVGSERFFSLCLLPKTWSALYEELSFQKKTRQKEKMALENDDNYGAGLNKEATALSAEKAATVVDKREKILAFLNDTDSLTSQGLTGLLNWEYVQHTFKELAASSRVAVEHSDDNRSEVTDCIDTVTSVSNEDNLLASLHEVGNGAVMSVIPDPPEEITLRAYQEELLSFARNGKNCLILLPTGTGKTIIVLKYIEELLAKGGMDRILFLAPKVRLVQQQYRRFQKYLTSNTYFRCGNSWSNSAAFSELLDIYRVYVMTPMCLVEAINRKEICITDFSLLILDECHNTQRDHPYMKLMNIYMAAKFSNDSRDRVCLPQVVGLTASPGVGRGGTLLAAKEHLRQLCCNLDIYMICTVKTHKEELERFVNEPSHEIHRCPLRRKDGFKKELESIMQTVEDEMLKALCLEIQNGVDSTRQIALTFTALGSNRGKQCYTQWISELETKLVSFAQDEDTYARLYASVQLLKMFQRALILNEDCESQNALDFLNEYIIAMQRDKPRLLDIDKWLLQQFQEHETDLVVACRDRDDFNPKLKMLEDILLDVLERDGEAAACMVFVKTLDLVYAVERWIANHPVLNKLTPGLIIGSRGADCGGMSKSRFDDVMTKFNQGVYKVVVCTSAAEEGLDFQACNVVVRYNYVTNVIAMIQTRGRARRMDSQYCVLDTALGASANKEQENLNNERLMEQAVNSIQSAMEANPNQFAQEMEEEQRRQFENRNLKEQSIEMARQASGYYTKIYNLLCRKCQAFACTSADVRVMENNCHVVLEPDFADKWDKVDEHPIGVMVSRYISFVAHVICAKCSLHWGLVNRHEPTGQQYPVLKLENFIVQEADTGKKLTGKIKWTKAPFHVRPLTDGEPTAP